MSSRRYAIIGCGGIGGYYGACLQRAGHEVHYLLRSDLEHVRSHGLRIDSPNGDFHHEKVHAHGRADEMPPCDVVVIALKTTHNDALPELLPQLASSDAAVLVLQNGYGIEPWVATLVPGRAVIGGACFICSHKAGPGHIRHLDYGYVTFAQHTDDGSPAGVTPQVQRFADDFRGAGIPASAEDDLLRVRWEKLVWNVPYNGLTVVENTTTDRLMSDPRKVEHVTGLMREVQSGCRAVTGRVIEDAFIEKMLTNTRKMTPYAPSMKLDFDAGRPMEVEAIFGAPHRAAQGVGCELPLIGELYQQLSALNRV